MISAVGDRRRTQRKQSATVVVFEVAVNSRETMDGQACARPILGGTIHLRGLISGGHRPCGGSRPGCIPSGFAGDTPARLSLPPRGQGGRLCRHRGSNP